MLRLEYLPRRICSEWRPGAISASTVVPCSIEATDVPSTETSNRPRRSSMPKAFRVTLSVADTVHLLSPGARLPGALAGSPVALFGLFAPNRRQNFLGEGAEFRPGPGAILAHSRSEFRPARRYLHRFLMAAGVGAGGDAARQVTARKPCSDASPGQEAAACLRHLTLWSKVP